MFSIVFMAFVILFYLLFVSHIWSCSSLLQTSEMLFQMTLMNFDASELIDASAFLGPFCFSLFILLVVFICMSMFLTIINQSFRRARENANDNQQIFSFMWNKFQRWTGFELFYFLGILGFKKLDELEIFEAEDAKMRSQYIDPIENFPNKIDQLLDALNRLYMTQKTDRL